MKIIKPSIGVIDWGITDNFSPNTTGIEILQKIERIGRVCYKSEGRISETSYINFISNLIKRGHLAVLEHHSISVNIICDRGVTHELVRHRLSSYCQESTRYCNYGNKEIEFIQPCFWDDGTDNDILNQAKWANAMLFAENTYKDLIRLGATPEEARSVLPNSLKTEIVITANLREWLHILKLRTSSFAHPQMREIMLMILEEFKKIIPIIFDNIGENNE